jgi:hypothetical protein
MAFPTFPPEQKNSTNRDPKGFSKLQSFCANFHLKLDEVDLGVVRIARGHELFVNLACSYYAMHSVAISEIFTDPPHIASPRRACPNHAASDVLRENMLRTRFICAGKSSDRFHRGEIRRAAPQSHKRAIDMTDDELAAIAD